MNKAIVWSDIPHDQGTVVGLAMVAELVMVSLQVLSFTLAILVTQTIVQIASI